MYSFTETNIHNLNPTVQLQPCLKVKCKCQRRLIQEQIYTCLSCSSYSCHYCTVPEFTSLQCRKCKASYQTNTKNVRCKMCFSCPYCDSVLEVAKDPKTKLYILLCQFCYWNTKQVNIKEQKVQNLVQALTKAGSSMKQQDLRIYQNAYHFIKESNAKVQKQNQTFKFSSNSTKGIQVSLSSLKNISMIDQPSISLKTKQEVTIKHSGLQEESKQYKDDLQYPQGLPLLAKKTRRCPQCKKPLTTFYRSRGNQHRVQLMHKDLTIIQCQKNICSESNLLKIKFIRQAYLQGEKCEPEQVKSVEADKEFKITIKVSSKAKTSSVDVDYIYIAQKGKKKVDL